jgi:cell fate regulator YaaT (PSP1 superfamily)
MAKVVAVRFRQGEKPYYFSAGKLNPQKGQGVIVETAKGNEYAVVEEGETEVDDKEIVAPLKPVVRIATEKDEELRKANRARRPEAIRICKQKIREHGLNMKLVDCEFNFDGSKVVFFFSAEGRVDFRELVKDLASVFHTRIELRQIGARDETHLLGGVAPCGREVCCANCMPEFRRVSIKMAKNQGLSLNPGKVSGLCGRLMCCLSYENDYYAEAYKKSPKVGSSVTTPEGKGTVVTVNMLKMIVRVKIEKDGGNFVYRDFPVDKVGFRRNAEKEEENDNSDEE